MKSLKTLVRARQREMDEKRRALNLLEDQADRFIGARAALADEQRREADLLTSNNDGGFGYGTFLKASRQRDAVLQQDLAALSGRIDAARGEIADAFAEIKRYELIEAAQIERERKKAAMVEQAEMDELGLNVFRRAEEQAG